MKDTIAEQTATLTQWQAACSKLDYLFAVGYRSGDREYDTTCESIHILQCKLRDIQTAELAPCPFCHQYTPHTDNGHGEHPPADDQGGKDAADNHTGIMDREIRTRRGGD